MRDFLISLPAVICLGSATAMVYADKPASIWGWFLFVGFIFSAALIQAVGNRRK